MEEHREIRPLDRSPWEPGPFQLASLSLVFAWVSALAAEMLLLGQEDATECLKTILRSIVNGRFTPELWNPLLLWFAIPFAVLCLLLSVFKLYRKTILLAGTIILAAILIFSDLKMGLL